MASYLMIGITSILQVFLARGFKEMLSLSALCIVLLPGSWLKCSLLLSGSPLLKQKKQNSAAAAKEKQRAIQKTNA